MTALVQPVRVDVALGVLRDILIDALSDIITDPKSIVIGDDEGGTPRGPRPLLLIEPITLPHHFGTFKSEREFRAAKDNVTFKVESAEDGRTYKARINGLPAKYTSDVGDSVTDIRGNLKAQVDLLGLPISTVDVGADSFRCDPSFLGAIYTATAVTPGSTHLTATAVESTTDYVKYAYGQRRFTVRLQAFAKTGRAGSGGAHEIINIAYEAIDLSDNLNLLRDHRVSIRALTNPQPLLSRVRAGTGARKESQAFFDAWVGLSSVVARRAYRLKQVEIALDIGDDTESFTVDINTPP